MFGKTKTEKVWDLELYVIYDSKAQTYGKPIFVKNKEVLLRDILQMFRDPQEQKNQLLTNAEDFSVFRVGGFNYSTGLVDATQPEHVANLHDLRSLVEPPERPMRSVSEAGAL